MGKSVYSLVLIDELVEAIDREAYFKNTNRSNLINQILAEHFSFVTPEKRMQEIFKIVEDRVNRENEFKVQTQLSDAMMMIQSALKYKYNPTIRYGIELYRESNEIVGELKVSFRTQNKALITAISDFFLIWANMEKKYIEKYFPDKKIMFSIKDGKLFRKFILPREEKHRTSEMIGKAIISYIESLDKIIKIYFEYIDEPEVAKRKMERAYVEYLNSEAIIV